MKYQTVELISRDEDLVIPTPSFLKAKNQDYWTQGPFRQIAPYAPQSVTKVVPDPKETRNKSPRPLTKQITLAECKRLGLIKMTPYFNTSETERWFIARVKCTDYSITRKVWCAPSCWWNTTIQPEEITRRAVHYYRNYTVNDVSHLPTISNSISSEKIEKAINNCKAEVVNSQFSGYDLLTELAELPETLEFLLDVLRRARHPIQGIRKLRDDYAEFKRRHPNEILTISPLDKQFLDRWMEYRYAIMPLVHSVRDIADLLGNINDVFKTDRARDRILPETVPTTSARSFVSHETTGEVVVKVIGKSKFSSPDLRLSQLITANPFLTAWELIPLSFVIDWFVNVGDWLFSQTSTYIDIAEQRAFCMSTRTKLKTTTYLNLTYESVTGKYDAELDWNVPRCYFDQPPILNTWHQSDHIDLKQQSFIREILYEKVVDSYRRDLFSPQDVKLSFNPSMNWKRWLDSFALLVKPTINALKR